MRRVLRPLCPGLTLVPPLPHASRETGARYQRCCDVAKVTVIGSCSDCHKPRDCQRKEGNCGSALCLGWRAASPVQLEVCDQSELGVSGNQWATILVGQRGGE